MRECSILVIGAGASGISAAIAAYKSGCKSIVVIDKASTVGGVLRQCTHSGFGLSIYGQELTGIEIAEKLSQSTKSTNINVLLNSTVIDISANKIATISSNNGIEKIEFKKLILATGCREKNFYSLAISGTRPQGIYTAGEAQMIMNVYKKDIGENVLIVGSGDLGMIMASQFKNAGKNVVGIVEKENHYGAMARNYHRYVEKQNINLMLSTQVVEILGEKRITGVKVMQNENNESKIVNCDTLVSAIGLVPDTKLVEKLVGCDWIYLCGNCKKVYDIVDSAIADSTMVGNEVGGVCLD